MFYRIVNYLLWIFFFLVTLCSFSENSNGVAPAFPLRSEAAGIAKLDYQVMKAGLASHPAQRPALCRQENKEPSRRISTSRQYSQAYGKTIHPL